MRAAFKLAVALLSLLLLATPIMACLIPAAGMTATEQDCCKRMAQECGKTGMPQSHSCCQTAPLPDHFAAIKSSSDVNLVHVALTVPYLLDHTFRIPSLQVSNSASWTADIHSPPISPPASIPILRI